MTDDIENSHLIPNSALEAPAMEGARRATFVGPALACRQLMRRAKATTQIDKRVLSCIFRSFKSSAYNTRVSVLPSDSRTVNKIEALTSNNRLPVHSRADSAGQIYGKPPEAPRGAEVSDHTVGVRHHFMPKLCSYPTQNSTGHRRFQRHSRTDS